jgi:hypothetical protein
MLRPPVGPTPRWFVARALDGFAPKLALVDALLATTTVIIVASVWRATTGPHGTFEQLVPMLGTALRWSVALPIAWAALGALDADRRGGLLDLARRRGVPARRWILGRAFGAGALVALTVGGPMVLVSVVLAGFGGGVEGALARFSLVVPSLGVGVATGLVFGAGAVALGTFFSSRGLAFGVLVGVAGLGALVDLLVPGPIGVVAHQVASPFLALEDLQAALFAVPHSAVSGAGAAIAAIAVVTLALYAATTGFEIRAEQRS